MKRAIIILMLIMTQAYFVKAEEGNPEKPVYVPGSEESGGTIFGTLTGKAPQDPDNPNNPDNPGNPDNPDNPNNPDNPILPEEPADPTQPNPPLNPDDSGDASGTTGSSTGSDTGDTTNFFLWMILFAGAYYILKEYRQTADTDDEPKE